MPKVFDIFTGDRQGRKHLPLAFIYDNWEKLFTGTRGECKEFLIKNNICDYVLVEHGKIPKKEYRPYQCAVVDHFQRICNHGNPVSYYEHGKTIYEYQVTFSTGKTTLIKSTNPSLSFAKGDKISFLKQPKYITLI